MTKAEGAYSTRMPDAGQNNPTLGKQNGPLARSLEQLPTRRAAVATLGAFIAAAGLSGRASPAAAADSPADAELLVLVEQWHRAREAELAAQAICDELDAAFEAEKPEPRDCLRHVVGDIPLNLPSGPDIGRISDEGDGSFYSWEEILHFPHTPPPWDPRDTARAAARKAEIKAEFDRVEVTRRELRERIGLTAAGHEWEKLADQRIDLGDAIAAMPARTLEGLRAKARIVAALSDRDLRDDHGLLNHEVIALSIVRDLAVPHA